MLKLLIVGKYPWVDGIPRGGPESVTKVLADGIARSRAFEVHVLTGEAGVAKPELCGTDAGVKVHVVPLLEKLGNATGFFIDKRRLRAKIKEIRPDLVHVQGTGFLEHAVHGCGCPVIMWISGIGFKEARYERGLSALRCKLGLRYHSASMRRAKNLILQNRYTYDVCSEWLSPEKVAYIDNPVDDAFFDVEPKEEEGRLLMVAVMRRLKGHEFLIRAISTLRSQGRQVVLHCIGPAVDPKCEYEIKSLVAHEDLDDCVFFVSRASSEALLDHFSRSSVVVLPSLVENAPLFVSESMAAGKAMVATPAGGIPEMIEDGRTGLIVPMEDSEALADALGRLLDSQELRTQIGIAAKAVAEQRFRAEVSVRKTLEFYGDVLGLPYTTQYVSI